MIDLAPLAPPAAAELRSRPVPVVIATATVPAFDPMGLLAGYASQPPPLLVWEGLESDGRRWTFVGFGAATRVDARGDDRCEAIRSAALPLLGSAIESREDGSTTRPRPRMFGGLAFRPAPIHAPPWSAFPDASFVMPRVLFATSDDDADAFVRVAVPASELGAAGAIDRALERALQTMRAAGGSATPAPRAAAAIADDADGGPFCDAVGDALACIDQGLFEKVVATRVTRLRSRAPLDLVRAVRGLRDAYRGCTIFAIERGGATFVGASPETLVALEDGGLSTEAVAGTISRRDSVDGRALRDSDKERREHQLVVGALAGVCRPFCAELHVAEEPAVRTLANVHHLVTPIRGRLAAPRHVLELVEAIHPTPAVCGFPRERAAAWIASHEQHERGWYTGAVGWFDARGDGRFAVAIRSGIVAGVDAWVYAGAGIVRGSDRHRELDETNHKRAALLAALGAGP